MNKFIILFLSCIFFLACQKEVESGSKNSIIDTSLDSLEVGQNIAINMENITHAKFIKIENAYGHNFFPIESFLKSDKVIIPSEFTKKKGILNVSVWNQKEMIWSKNYYLKPYQELAKIENYFGQKFIPIDIATEPEIVSILLDSNDNITRVQGSLQYEFIQNQNKKIQNKNANEDYIVMPVFHSTILGKQMVSVHYKNVYSAEEYYYIEAGFPTHFSINSKINHTLADGQSLYEISTTSIKDRYGNLVSNGTEVYFTIEVNGKKTQLLSSTQEGIARIKILHPTNPETQKISAHSLPNAQSNTIQMNFKKAVDNIPFRIQERKLQIGPISTLNFNFIAQSTPVQVYLYDSRNQKIFQKEIITENGEAKLEFPNSLAKGTYYLEMECLSYKTSLERIEL